MASETIKSSLSTPAVKNMNSKAFSESTKKQKKKISKLLLDGFDGFQILWPEISVDTTNQALLMLTRKFEELHFKIITTKEKKLLLRPEKSPADVAAADMIELRQKSVATLKCALAFGINEVTKGLEKNHLALVIVDRSTKPFSMISHLPQLASDRKTPALALDGLSARLAGKVGLGSLVAFAFKKDCVFFASLIGELISLVPGLPKKMTPAHPVTASGKFPVSAGAHLSGTHSNPDTVSAGSIYQTVNLKRVEKDVDRAEKLKARQKKPRPTEETDKAESPVKIPAKRKAKMVKLGKRHRAKNP